MTSALLRGVVTAWVVLWALPVFAQPATPCPPGGGVWDITPTTATLWICNADGTVWLQAVRSWGGITGTLSNQTDLQTVLDAKQASGTYATGTGTASGTNTGDQTSVSGNAGTATTLQTARTINGVSFNGSANITVPAAGSTLTDTVPFAVGGRAGSAATSATTGTMTVNMTTAIVTITPTGACTFNASGGVVGQIVTFIITTSGTSSFVLTWGTNFRKVGTLATGTVSARFFAVTFVCVNGTLWQEIARTAVQT